MNKQFAEQVLTDAYEQYFLSHNPLGPNFEEWKAAYLTRFDAPTAGDAEPACPHCNSIKGYDGWGCCKQCGELVRTDAPTTAGDGKFAQDFLIEANLKSERGLQDAPQEYIDKHLKHIDFLKWKNALIEVTAKETGEDARTIKINDAEARKWFDDGFTPYQTFRETYQNENDGE